MVIKNKSGAFYGFYALTAPDTGTIAGVTLNGLDAGNQFDVYTLNDFNAVAAAVEIETGINLGNLAVVYGGAELSQADSLAFFRSMGTDKIVPSVENKSDLEAVVPSPEDKIVYVCSLDANFKYTGSQWIQCGENTILREGLVKGAIYVNQVKIG